MTHSLRCVEQSIWCYMYQYPNVPEEKIECGAWIAIGQSVAHQCVSLGDLMLWQVVTHLERDRAM